jgi:hypothetical protein
VKAGDIVRYNAARVSPNELCTVVDTQDNGIIRIRFLMDNQETSCSARYLTLMTRDEALEVLHQYRTKITDAIYSMTDYT